MVFSPPEYLVSAPDVQGKRHFVIRLVANDYNTGTVTDQNAQGNSTVAIILSAYGKWALFREILFYNSGAAGVDARVSINSGDGPLNISGLTNRQITTAATDVLRWSGLEFLKDLTNIAAGVVVAVSGYAATDDMRLILEGEVW